ncbi:hypothetical protein E1H12_05990 [Geitlerinema sp. P-1104]|uniref:hypothetical protein n=1 Tax=Geitlerinema sp. P-1104 TaxID=2546230 RepID=UPI001476F97E|nr:hypothetical protein [Geitlerinema sp. P-1104]NMG58088.1 hypothetical protein [Geitlerinema sp. P-1104]
MLEKLVENVTNNSEYQFNLSLGKKVQQQMYVFESLDLPPQVKKVPVLWIPRFLIIKLSCVDSLTFQDFERIIPGILAYGSEGIKYFLYDADQPNKIKCFEFDRRTSEVYLLENYFHSNSDCIYTVQYGRRREKLYRKVFLGMRDNKSFSRYSQKTLDYCITISKHFLYVVNPETKTGCYFWLISPRVTGIWTFEPIGLINKHVKTMGKYVPVKRVNYGIFPRGLRTKLIWLITILGILFCLLLILSEFLGFSGEIAGLIARVLIVGLLGGNLLIVIVRIWRTRKEREKLISIDPSLSQLID